MDFVTTKIWTRLVTAIILVLGMSPGSQQLSRSHILASLTLHLAIGTMGKDIGRLQT